MGTFAENSLASALPWYVGAAREHWAKLCWLVVPGPTPLRPEETPGAAGTQRLLPKVKELKGRPGACSLKSWGKSKRKLENGGMPTTPAIAASETTSRKPWPTTNLYQPEHVGHHPLWVGQKMAWAWQRLSHQNCAKGLMWQEVT